jgi:hypothetical protein
VAKPVANDTSRALTLPAGAGGGALVSMASGGAAAGGEPAGGGALGGGGDDGVGDGAGDGDPVGGGVLGVAAGAGAGCAAAGEALTSSPLHADSSGVAASAQVNSASTRFMGSLFLRKSLRQD